MPFDAVPTETTEIVSPGSGWAVSLSSTASVVFAASSATVTASLTASGASFTETTVIAIGGSFVSRVPPMPVAPRSLVTTVSEAGPK